MRLAPGAASTGFLIAAAFALVAQSGALGAGLVWDDAVLLGRDPRILDLAFVWKAFGESFFGALGANEMYRPVVNASLTLDWHLSGSEPGNVAAWWFHAVNLLLHAANAGLVYLFFLNLTKRRLGAPLLAAVLFAVHPLASEPTSWVVGRCDLLGTFFGLLSGILLVRSALRPALVVPAVLCYGASLFAKANAAMMPLIVALGVIAYHGVPLRRLLSRRLLPRFAWFAVPAVVWFLARRAVLGAPFPQDAGLRWHDVSVVDGALGVGRAAVIYATNLVLPVRLCGDYSADAASNPAADPPVLTGILGLALLVGALAVGLSLLRSRPRLGFPLAAFVIALVPVLQVVPIGAIVADRFLYLPMAFAFLLVGEGIEALYKRAGQWPALGVSLVVVGALGVQSHVRAGVWRDDVTFNRDVLECYPGAHDATVRLAHALSDRGPAGRAEAREILRAQIARVERPDEELALLGAILLEERDARGAEAVLRRAVDAAGRKPLLGARSRYNLAVALIRQGRDAEAIPLLREALARTELPEARRLLDRLTR